MGIKKPLLCRLGLHGLYGWSKGWHTFCLGCGKHDNSACNHPEHNTFWRRVLRRWL